ncbi:MAG: hypothetical protein WBQ71_25325 [Trebonia sp.]
MNHGDLAWGDALASALASADRRDRMRLHLALSAVRTGDLSRAEAVFAITDPSEQVRALEALARAAAEADDLSLC